MISHTTSLRGMLRLAGMAFLVGLGTTSFAVAEGFSSGYVTGFTSEVECMNTARDAMQQQFRRHGMEPDMGEATFSVLGFEVPPGVTQVAIICSEDQGRVTASVAGYSLQEDGTRLDTINVFLDMLEGVPVAPVNPAPTGSK